MDLSVPAVTLAALLLGTARATGFVLLAPPFNSKAIPGPVKAAFALALSVLLSTQIAPSLPTPTAGYLVVTAVTEVVIGAALGFVVQVLFTSGGHLLIVKGFATSYVGLPVGGDVPTDQIAAVLLTAFSMMFLAALQIAGPMVAVLLLADVALALLSRAAPALNIFAIGFPVKIMLTLAMLGLTFPLLPPALDALLEHATRAMISLRSG